VSGQDGAKPYRHSTAGRHARGTIPHLRELPFVEEQERQPWAMSSRGCCWQMQAAVAQAGACGEPQVPAAERAACVAHSLTELRREAPFRSRWG
jgi:hypothetical protein